MELYQLTTFRTIAALGSFSQAAELLGYAQSTISEHIKSLETELQTRLFKRAGSKRVALTPAGEALLKYAQKMSNLEEEIKAEVNQPAEPQGTLSVRVPETVSIHFLPPVLKRFRTRFSKVNLDFMNCVYFDLPEELKAGVVDLGFLIIDTFQAASLATETLRPIPLVMVTHPAHPLAAGAPIDVSQLKGEPLIVPANDCSYVQMLDRILLEQKVKLSLVWRFNSIGAIKQVLASGIGVSILPEVAVQSELANGSLAILPWREGGITANLLMIWQKNKWQPPVLQAFMEMAREGLVL
ncbi:MAG TPA: LysR family transcriptional regulator [Anaerolineales bacterium]|nr:LysR family transcriptional regulator [Anaerolineales bacterium]